MRSEKAEPEIAERGAVPRPAARRIHLPARVYLVGFMGCGKTTVGRALASRLHWRFLDLDRVIQDHSGLTIAEIFESRGEKVFRKLEYEALSEVASSPQRVVVALGGGAYSSQVNRAVISGSGAAVWLDVPFRVAASRIRSSKERPLAQSPDEMIRLFRTRVPFYHEADIRVRAGNAPPATVAEAIVQRLREDWIVVAERRRLQL